MLDNMSVLEIAKKAKESAGKLASMSTADKNRVLQKMADSLDQHRTEILSANEIDLKNAKEEVKKGKMTESLYARLKLDAGKLNDIITGIRQVAELPDPVGIVTFALEMDDGLSLYRVTCPIGVVGVIFEARPDALTQIASLCMKSGNAVLLKGGKEAEHSNRTLFQYLREAAVACGVPADAMALLETREEVNELLKARDYVDLIVPRGSSALVRYIQENTEIPVLGHADGICHVYIDASADPKKAIDVTVDSKIQYPAACNAVETILIHKACETTILPKLVEALKQKSVEVRTKPDNWKTEYGDLIVALKVVNDLDEAIRHINTYGSHHTETIVTQDKKAFDRFFAEVDSAGVYWNASTRFADGFRYGFGAEVGISTGKLHPRGPVGLDGLVTYKYKIVGNGQTVAMYSGPSARRFTHKKIGK